MPSIFESALHYAANGFAVIPLQPNGKKPLSRHGSKDASKDEEQIKKWWTIEPNANVGIVTGSISGIVGVDVDEKDGRPGKKSLEVLFDGISKETLTVITPTGGMHLYFSISPGVALLNKADLLPGIDIRGEGGYLVAPPSVINDVHYKWVQNSKLAPLPLPVHAQINEKKRTASASSKTIGQGSRNQRLASLAGTMRRQGAGRDAILTFIKTENQERCDPPLTDDEVELIVNSIMRYEPNLDDHLTYTDRGNAERFIREHGADLRYVYEFGRWLVWNGSHWTQDKGDGMDARMNLTVRGMYNDALQEQDAEKRKFMIGWSKTSASAAKSEAMVKVAANSPRVLIDQGQLDNDPWLLGVRNGVLDLRSGHLCESKREDLVTNCAAVEFTPHAECPQFVKFLDQIFDSNAPVIEFLQRAIGYSLTGVANEQCLFFAYGRGANGKSTLFHVLSTMMGDYARSISADILMDRPQGGQTNDLARLRGARFIPALEIEEGKRMAEALVKRVTGGEKITARFLYGEFFEYVPVFKLWLAANHYPTIRGTDGGIWRRIRLIPFTVSIPDKDRDKTLPDKLLTELSGILNWAIDGCLAWQKQGLNPPAEVTAVTDEYRNDMDVFGAWIKECCVEKSDTLTKSTALYDSFKRWAPNAGEYVMSQTRFGMKMSERGYERVHYRDGSKYKGIALVANEYAEQRDEI